MRRALYSLNVLLGIVFLLIIGFSLLGCSAGATFDSPMRHSGPCLYPATSVRTVDFGLCQTTIQRPTHFT